VVKKRVTPKKSTATRKSAAPSRPRRGDRSRLDLRPLHDHIRDRIKKLKKQKERGQPAAAAAAGAGPMGGSIDDTIERLQAALDTLIDICHPTMDIPI
jgi:hypothetical protein